MKEVKMTKFTYKSCISSQNVEITKNKGIRLLNEEEWRNTGIIEEREER